MDAYSNTKDFDSLSEKHWRERLTEEEYQVLMQAGTESPFTSRYKNSFEHGRIICAGCDNELSDSGT